MQEKNLPLKEKPLKPATEIDRQKFLLWPILETLKVPKEKYRRYKFHPDQMCGMAIAEIRCLQSENNRLRKSIKRLGKENAVLRQLEALVCHTPYRRVAG